MTRTIWTKQHSNTEPKSDWKFKSEWVSKKKQIQETNLILFQFISRQLLCWFISISAFCHFWKKHENFSSSLNCVPVSGWKSKSRSESVSEAIRWNEGILPRKGGDYIPILAYVCHGWAFSISISSWAQ